VEVTCLGTERGLETRLIPLRGYPLELIPAVPMPRTVTPKLLTVPGRLTGAVNTAASVLDRTRAQVVVGFGGYVATPAYLAARRRKVPIVVHEANPRAGIANRLGARFTTHVFTGHPDTQLRNGKYLGIPIRREIAELDRLAIGDKARAQADAAMAASVDSINSLLSQFASANATVVAGGKTGADVSDAQDRRDAILADLASQASVRRLAAEVLERYARLDVLINNAGINKVSPFAAIERDLRTQYLVSYVSNAKKRGVFHPVTIHSAHGVVSTAAGFFY